MGRQRVWPLAGLGPDGLKAQWRPSRRTPPVGSRVQTGLSFLCPAHRSHRLRIQLVNPADGGNEEPWEGAIRAERTGKTIGELTLTSSRGDSILDFGPCGKLWIIKGKVYWAV